MARAATSTSIRGIVTINLPHGGRRGLHPYSIGGPDTAIIMGYQKQQQAIPSATPRVCH
jgi:hypothetical protein